MRGWSRVLRRERGETPCDPLVPDKATGGARMDERSAEHCRTAAELDLGQSVHGANILIRKIKVQI